MEPMKPMLGKRAIKMRGLVWLLVLLCWSGWSWGAEVKPAHYSLVTVRMLPSRTDTVVDEVWQDGQGRWRLERRSDRWDNGLIAVSDGQRVIVNVPGLTQNLDIPVHAMSELINPVGLAKIQTQETMKQVREESLSGRQAILWRGTAGTYQVKLWVDKATRMLIREERFDRAGRPYQVLVRTDLPLGPQNSDHYRLETQGATRQVYEWRTSAIDTWVAEQLQASWRLKGALPATLRIEDAELMRSDAGQVVVVRIARGDTLISLFFAPATGNPPPKRRILDRGLLVQSKRIASFDITLVGELTTREAAKLFAYFSQQLL